MNIGVISVRYARALLESATKLKVEDTVYGEMSVLAHSFIQVPQLRLTIDNPMLAKDKKSNLLVCACGNDVSPLTKRFISLVLQEGREFALQFMANSYITLYRKQKNIIHGKLITAATVSLKEENKMQQLVARKTKGTVEFQTEVDPSLIGGFVLEYDTYRLDESVKSQLNNILKQLNK
jgi:F-type H+-transporting ATPase subunit delta